VVLPLGLHLLHHEAVKAAGREAAGEGVGFRRLQLDVWRGSSKWWVAGWTIHICHPNVCTAGRREGYECWRQLDDELERFMGVLFGKMGLLYTLPLAPGFLAAHIRYQYICAVVKCFNRFLMRKVFRSRCAITAAVSTNIHHMLQ
jgi:hypothetical protein